MKSIAAGWLQTTLGEIAVEQLNNGIFRKNPEYSGVANDGLPVVWVEELFRGTKICTSASRRLNPTPVEVSKYGLRNGDILFCRSSLKLDGIGFSNVYVGKDFEALFECHIIRISPNPKLVFPNFLNYQLRTEHSRNLIKSRAKTSTMTTIDQKGICEVPIRLPEIEEQRRIVAILDQADALRAKRREALAQLDSLTQSIFIEMFGDPVSNERQWPNAAIGSIVSEMRGGAPLEPDDFTDSGFPILHKGAIKPLGKIQVDAKKKTFASNEYAASKPNSIADRRCVAVTLRDLVPTGPSIGLAADLQHGVYDQYLLAQGAYAFHLDPNTVTPEYFVHLSNMPTFRYVLLQNSVGSTQIHIRTPIYLAIKVPLPPIKLQREFSKLVRVIDGMKSQHGSSLSELSALFASLQHRAFRGEL